MDILSVKDCEERDSDKTKIEELQQTNRELEKRIRELENENRWLKIFAYKPRRV